MLLIRSGVPFMGGEPTGDVAVRPAFTDLVESTFLNQKVGDEAAREIGRRIERWPQPSGTRLTGVDVRPSRGEPGRGAAASTEDATTKR